MLSRMRTNKNVRFRTPESSKSISLLQCEWSLAANTAAISRERVMKRGKVSRDRVTSTSVRQKFLINQKSFSEVFFSKTSSIMSKRGGGDCFSLESVRICRFACVATLFVDACSVPTSPETLRNLRLTLRFRGRESSVPALCNWKLVVCGSKFS